MFSDSAVNELTRCITFNCFYFNIKKVVSVKLLRRRLAVKWLRSMFLCALLNIFTLRSGCAVHLAACCGSERYLWCWLKYVMSACLAVSLMVGFQVTFCFGSISLNYDLCCYCSITGK